MTNSITSGTEQIGSEPSRCPMHAGQSLTEGLGVEDELVFPAHKRVVTQYSTDAEGLTELHLYYGDKEISFDEPELFAFGENLAKQSHFIAGTATSWGDDYDWPRIQALLEQLLEEGILHYANGYDTASCGPEGARPSPLPPALTTVARTWSECEAITEELTGHSLPLAYLELAIPIWRIAHMVLDAEGRQVGEANVFPKALRLDIPTDWRICQYPGSRYQSELPMNVTALKSMRNYWPQMMAALLRIRDAYLLRFPHARQGMTVGDIEILSTLVLALPTYLLMRSGEHIENGQLHPALSSMFRVTDGLRTTMREMLFVPLAGSTLDPNTPMNSSEIYAYAERTNSFHSFHGVCAGPKAMIEEFLRVMVEGQLQTDTQSTPLDAPVQAALENLEPAFDYGLYGLQVHSIAFSLWPAMTRTYTQLLAIVDAWSEQGSETFLNLQESLRSKVHILKTETLCATEEWRTNRERIYALTYEQCALGLDPALSEQALSERLAPVWADYHANVADQLRVLLQRHLCGTNATDSPDVRNLLGCLMNYFLREQAILRVATEIQQQINDLLGRAQPEAPISGALLDIHNQLQGSGPRRLPYLEQELEDRLGIRIVVTKDRIEITESGITRQ